MLLQSVAVILLCSTVGPDEPPRESWGAGPVPKLADLEPRGVIRIYEWRLRQLEQAFRRPGGTAAEGEKVRQLLRQYSQVSQRLALL